jgi:hypothetical protein
MTSWCIAWSGQTSGLNAERRRRSDAVRGSRYARCTGTRPTGVGAARC